MAYQSGFIHKTVSVIEHHYENVVKTVEKDFLNLLVIKFSLR